MSLQSILYLALLFIAAFTSGGLSLYTRRQQGTLGARSFSLLTLAIFQWAVCYILQLTSPNMPTKIFWEKITFIAVVTVPVMWFIFALEYSDRKDWISRPRIPLLFIVPLITLLVVWTNELHHLFWTRQEIFSVDNLLMETSDNGLWFWFHAAYSYILILAGTILIVRTLLRWPAQYRRQLPWVFLAVAAPWLANVITVFKLFPIMIDLTPFAFTITGVGLAYALFHQQLLDLAPFARDVVIEEMKEGMIVLDASNRIVDINLAAQSILNLSGQPEPIGKQLAEIFVSQPELIERYRNVAETRDEIKLGEAEAQRCYELTLSPLRDAKKNLIGRLIIARDITDRKRAEEQLRQLSRAVEANPTSIVITDIQGKILYVNPKFTEVTGYSLGGNPGKESKYSENRPDSGRDTSPTMGNHLVRS